MPIWNAKQNPTQIKPFSTSKISFFAYKMNQNSVKQFDLLFVILYKMKEQYQIKREITQDQIQFSLGTDNNFL